MTFGERRGMSRGRVSPILFEVDDAHGSTVIEEESALDGISATPRVSERSVCRRPIRGGFV